MFRFLFVLLASFSLLGTYGCQLSTDQREARAFSEDEAWQVAEELDTREAYEEFLADYPDGDYAPTARLEAAEKGGDASVDESTGDIVLPDVPQVEATREAAREEAAREEAREKQARQSRQRRAASADDAEGVRFSRIFRVQEFQNYDRDIQGQMERGNWQQAIRLQEEALELFNYVYDLSVGARLRAKYRLLDLYEKTYAYNKADILRSKFDADEAEDLAATTTLAELLSMENEARPIFLGLIDPDPETLSSTRGVQKVNTVNYTVKGYVHAYDGLEYFTINGDSVRIFPNAYFRHALTLEEGLNPLFFEARSREGSFLRDTIYLDYESTTATVSRPARKLLLAIALETYPESSDWPSLQTPLHDARAFLQVMRDQYGFQVFDTLFEARATLGGVVESFKRLRFETIPEDEVLIYFAGHGRYDEEYTRQGYWIFQDREWSNSDQLAYLNKVTADDILVVADACFAGSFYYQNLPPEADPQRERARWVLASGRLQPVQDLDPDQPEHSPFAAVLLDYLQRQTEPFSAYELGRTIEDPVYERSNANQRTLVRPFSGDTGGEWMFVPAVQ